MATIDFPTSPVTGQSYSFAGKTWVFNGTGWAMAAASNPLSPTVVLPIACSDEATALTVGTGKVTMRMPFGFNLSAVRASVTTAPTGSAITVDIKKNGTSVLSTKITIDATKKTSLQSAVQAVMSATAFTDDDEVTIDVTTVGSIVAGAGLKVYLIGVAKVNMQREVLLAARTYYVSTTGNDANSGLAVGSPFLTIQKAIDVACGLDLSIYSITIQVADGSYPSSIALKPYVGVGPVQIIGNVTTPDNVVIATTAATVTGDMCGKWKLTGVKLSSSAGDILQVTNFAVLDIGLINFGACGQNCMGAYSGAKITVSGNITVSGAVGSSVFNAQGGTIASENRTVTLVATPSIGGAFATVSAPSFNTMYSMTFVGSATGKRYSITGNGVCYVNGAAATYFPGSIAGTTATGGQYA